ncbi:MAG: hypothetical protein HOC27_06960 [Phycisphaerae bacterium]|nr:hypothetical protein [Phycisphaerae bacterium]
MNNIAKHAITMAVVVSALFCGTLFAQPIDIQEQLDALRQRLDDVQSDTEGMRNELDELKVEELDWLTKERADEIRVLVREVLADADARNSLAGDGLLGGWSDGFFLASSDGRFKLNIGGLMQQRFLQNFVRSDVQDRWRGGLESTRTRLNFSGHVFDKDTTFLVQAGYGYLDPNAVLPNFRIADRLWDAWIKFKLDGGWSAKLGVFMLPFTRESLVSDEYQLAVDRSLIDYRLGLARSQGVEFTWAGDATRVFLAMSNGSITLRGVPASQTNPTPPWASLQQDVEWSFTARTEFLLEGRWGQFNQFTSPPGSERGMLWGVAVHAQNGERTGRVGLKQDQVGITSDFSFHSDGVTFFASGTFHNQKNLRATIPNGDWVGYVVQASTYMTDKTEYFVRFASGGVLQDSLGNDDVNILTNGINWYLDGQGLKVTSDFGWNFGEISGGANGSPGMANSMLGWRPQIKQSAQWVFRTQLQLAF